MAYALITSTGVVGSATTPPVDTTGATILVAAVTAIATPVPAPTDSNGNTWLPLTEQGSGVDIRLFYVPNPTVGVGQTFSISSVVPSLAIMAFSGAKISGPFDVENGSQAGAGTTIQTGSVTPSENDELIIAACSHQGDAIGIDSGFTLQVQIPLLGGVGLGIDFAFLIQTTAGAVNPTFTLAASDNHEAAIATFKAAAAGGDTLFAQSVM